MIQRITAEKNIMYPGLPNHIIEERQDIIFRKVRGILNKITPETFDKLSKELVNVGLDSPRTLRGVIYLLFDKALKDLKYSSLYAKLCQILSEKVPNFETEPGPNTFCKFLISKCEDEFERRRKATEDFDGKNELTDEEYELKAIAKLKMLGNIKFICELGKKRLLQEEILHECIRGLLSKKKERPLQDQAQDLECLCQIMKTIGSLLDGQASRNLMNQYFERIDMFSKKPELPSRIRFMLRDVIDLRNNNWRPRPFQREDTVPQPLSKLREEAGFDLNTANTSIDKLGNNKNLLDLSKLHGSKLSALLLDDDPGFTTSADFHWGSTSFMLEDPSFDVFCKSSSTNYNNNNNSSSNSSPLIGKPSIPSSLVAATLPTTSSASNILAGRPNINQASLPHANSFSSASTFHKTLKTQPFNQQHLNNNEPHRGLEYRDSSYPNSSIRHAQENINKYNSNNTLATNNPNNARTTNQKVYQPLQGERRIFGDGVAVMSPRQQNQLHQHKQPSPKDNPINFKQPTQNLGRPQQHQLPPRLDGNRMGFEGDKNHHLSNNQRNRPDLGVFHQQQKLPSSLVNTAIDQHVNNGPIRRFGAEIYGEQTMQPSQQQYRSTGKTSPILASRQIPQQQPPQRMVSGRMHDNDMPPTLHSEPQRQQVADMLDRRQPDHLARREIDVQQQSHPQVQNQFQHQQPRQPKFAGGQNYRLPGRGGGRQPFGQFRDQGPGFDRMQDQLPESDLNMNWRDKKPEIVGGAKPPVSPLSSASSSTSTNRHASNASKVLNPTTRSVETTRISQVTVKSQSVMDEFNRFGDPTQSRVRSEDAKQPMRPIGTETSFGRRPFVPRTSYDGPGRYNGNIAVNNDKSNNVPLPLEKDNNAPRNYRGSQSQSITSQQQQHNQLEQNQGMNVAGNNQNRGEYRREGHQPPPLTPRQPFQAPPRFSSETKQSHQMNRDIANVSLKPTEVNLQPTPIALPGRVLDDNIPFNETNLRNTNNQNLPARDNTNMESGPRYNRREPRRFGSGFQEPHDRHQDAGTRRGDYNRDRFEDRNRQRMHKDHNSDSVGQNLADHERVSNWRKDSGHQSASNTSDSLATQTLAPLLAAKTAPLLKPSETNFSLRPSHNLTGRTPLSANIAPNQTTVKQPDPTIEDISKQPDQKSSKPTPEVNSQGSADQDKSAARNFHVNKFISVLSEYSSDSPPNASKAAAKIKELKISKSYQHECLVCAMKQSITKTEADRNLVEKLFVQLMPNIFETSTLVNAFKVVFEQLKTLEVETPKVKSLVAGFVSQAILDNLLSLEDLGNVLHGGKHHPLFLLVLQKLEKAAGQAWLSEKFIASKINLMDMLPEVDRTKDRLATALNDRCLGFLDPMLTVEPDLWRQMKERDAAPAAVYRWIKENVDQSVQDSPTFAHVLMSCLLKYIHTVAREKAKATDTQPKLEPEHQPDDSPAADKSTPTNSSGNSSGNITNDVEKEMLTKYQQVLQLLLKDKQMQLNTLYSLQTFYHGLNFPKGSLVRWFHMLYDMNIVDEEVFFIWKEELNDEFPGKGQALFQVNFWLNLLAEAESEEEDDDE